MSRAEPLTLHLAGTDDQVTVSPDRLVVAGYTGRDEAAVAAHIAELAEIGVPPPATVPAFYDLDPGLLTVDPAIEVSGPATSGEVEPVVIRHGGRYFLAVGSDHTDRALERTDIEESKAACPKPIAATVVDSGTDLAAADWDGMTIESSVDGQRYQRGSASALRHPAELIQRMTEVLGEVAGDLVLYCGTVPLLADGFVYGADWRVRLELPGGPILSHAYQTKRRSV